VNHDRALVASTGRYDRVRDAQELRHKPGGRPVRPRGMDHDPPSGRRERAKRDAVNADICQRAWNEGDAHAGLHQRQLGLKVLSFSDDSHGHVQGVEQIEDVSATAWTTFGMSDDDLAVKIGRVEVGSAGKRMGFRKGGQPLFGPHRIADDRHSLDGRKHQPKVDPATLQCSDLCNGRQFQQVR